MSKIIEIIDSDDDNQIPVETHIIYPPIAANTSNNMETDDSPQTQSRRRRRKSVLHVMNDPDMQFQTIAVDDDDDEEDNFQKSADMSYQKESPVNKPKAAAVRPMPKTQKNAPKIFTSKASICDDMVDAAYEKYLNDPETISDIYAVAEERIRINYLLNLNAMPDINFSLYTRPELWQMQLDERLKQRKILQNWDSARVQENRRNLLQNNNIEYNIQ